MLPNDMKQLYNDIQFCGNKHLINSKYESSHECTV